MIKSALSRLMVAGIVGLMATAPVATAALAAGHGGGFGGGHFGGGLGSAPVYRFGSANFGGRYMAGGPHYGWGGGHYGWGGGHYYHRYGVPFVPFIGGGYYNSYYGDSGCWQREFVRTGGGGHWTNVWVCG